MSVMPTRPGLPEYGYYRRLGFGLIETAKALDHRDPVALSASGITFACSKSVIDSRRCLIIARSIRWILASQRPSGSRVIARRCRHP